MTIKTLLLIASLSASAALCLSPGKLAAQAILPPDPIGERPPPTPPAAQISMGDGTGVNLKFTGPRSRRVRLLPGQQVTIVMQYDPALSGLILDAGALDGGQVSFEGRRIVIDDSGTAVFTFGGAEKPGLYRLALNCGGAVSTLQFWVVDPDAPDEDGTLLAPTTMAPARKSVSH
jgi:hypothetical protein